MYFSVCENKNAAPPMNRILKKGTLRVEDQNLLFAVTLFETIDTTFSVHNSLFTSEKWV